MTSGTTRRGSFWAIIRNSVAVAAVLLAFLAWNVSRDLPGFLRARLERALSGGVLAVRFEKASASLSGWITVEKVRINVKRSLDPPVATASRLRIRLVHQRNKPFYAWVTALEADDLVVRPMFDIEFADGGGGGFVQYMDYATRENDWFSDPVSVTLRNADIFTVKCHEATFLASARNSLVAIDNISLEIRSSGFDERVAGWASFAISPFEARARLSGTLTHEVVTGLVNALEGYRVNKILSHVSAYSAPLQVSGELLWRLAPQGPSTQDLRFAATGSHFNYNGKRLEHGRVVLQWVSAPRGDGVEKRLTISPVEFNFEDGGGTLAAVWYPAAHSMDARLSARAYPQDLSRLLYGESPAALTNVVFSTPPEFESAAHFPFTDAPSVSTGSFSAKDAVFRSIALSDVRFDFAWEEDGYLSVTNLSAGILGGSVKGFASLDDGLARYRANASFTDLDCAAFRRQFIGKDIGGDGTVAIDLSLAGDVGKRALDTLSGSGSFEVRGGNILRLPLFAGLTDFIGRNVPGVDLLLMQSDAASSFAITNGLVNIDGLHVSGNLFSLVASGKCRLNKEGMPVDMLAQLRFFHSQSLIGRLARLVTLPVSKMMEFKVRGPAESAEWDYVGLIDRVIGIFREDKDPTALADEKKEPKGKERPGAKWRDIE